MKPYAQRIAILTAQGWSDLTRSGRRGEDGPTQALRGTDPQGRKDRLAPNPLNSLDAMHEAEKTLDRQCLLVEYINCLGSVLARAQLDSNWSFHATAAQRAEAFLRTLNLWTDEN